MSKDEPTNGELKIMLDNVKDSANRIEKSVETLTKSMQDSSIIMIELSTSIKSLNEIINKHDKALFNKDDGVLTILDQLKGAFKTVSSLKVVIPVLFTVIATSFGLYIEKIKNDIIKETAKQSEDISYKTTNKVFDERINSIKEAK